jgi:hypothetical protein
MKQTYSLDERMEIKDKEGIDFRQQVIGSNKKFYSLKIKLNSLF